ncbi:MAG: SurA N-terminal domain-containing protein, partial [Deltaproteobacteria bacterium]|nr:SurA N-terminal domain-containing protein [Deltaproteobacteria bacterium]
MIFKPKIFLWVLVLPILLSSPLPSLGLTDKASKKKVASVNGAVITHAEFDREVNGIRQKMLMKGTRLNASQLSKISSQVLESLINRELLYQEGL